MRFFAPVIMTCLALLSYVLFFMIEAFPTLDRPTSFAALAFVSFGVTFFILMDGVRRAKSGKRVLWTYFVLACTLALMTLNLIVWFAGELVS
ncbi:hypothetical protein [Exiguobacterium aurantiacum]|uniref:Uncharacterized protein n=1 Tax=Exiguobacterium aurantiacum TaxID=33987 RepID=A0A377FV29_9BACL|nr:hypothetical protein [Exiguobacterium aurantiacum]STO08671.1 Uncharacterised protein [Exiguobacterium aurantiacum]